MIELWIVFIAVIVSCFFTAANYALMDYSRSRLAEIFERRGRADAMDRLDAWRDRLLLTTALLRTAMNLTILVGMLWWLFPPGPTHSGYSLVLALGGAAVLVAVFGVAVPLSWARHAAEPLLAQTLGLLISVARVLQPLMILLHVFDPIVRRLLGVPKPSAGDTAPLEQEILDAVSEGEKSGLVDEEQKEMIQAVVALSDTTVDQIMTPRTDIEGIGVQATLEDVKAFVAQAGHSRIPVYEGDLDHIIGVLYVKDLIPLLGGPGGHGSAAAFDMRQILREAVFVPESKTIRDLLAQLKELKVHMALVLDEYGGTAGLVTIEDILEEIVGEIRDEYEPADEEVPGIQKIDDQIWDVHGRVYIDEVNDELGIDLPDEEDYDTVGGFVFATLGRIPETGEQFEYGGLRFTITLAQKTRVDRVRIETVDRDEAAPVAEPSENQA